MYLLVTPAKNEESNLPQLIDSIMKQTIKPSLWVIVDDNSCDRTAFIIQDICLRHNWIKTINLFDESNYDWLRYGHVVKSGFNYALQIAHNSRIEYDFLGILDADVFPESNYFELLIRKLNCNPKIGIISGTLYIQKNGFLMPEDNDKRPRGGARLYRKLCFENIGGFSELPSPDSVSEIKTLNRGWSLYREESAIALHNRKSSSAQGLWNGLKKRGEGRYFLNYHPFNAILTGFVLTTKPPFYMGAAFIYGYFKGWILRSPKSSDKEVCDHYWQSWIRLKERSKKAIINLLLG